ncbi:MAG: hypothetical protein F2681_04605 [Actinobacteria bacterium]|uniref:Unannotated protein n=1 Tax=freshwater metagenome TaxID=449393 RepID=A0A6J7ABP0_9ZZZZ|nr:hypothetical protein [Actinomycetota bacterium]MSW76517.1 hypothetical protein [Actinomycetota bacterium]MSX56470.1 hypothetical protein [Actinomycetota bacterium]MSX93758.1 hypothetical protein [Actinomycetota bacterium]MSZ82405.1 hypothetical protein [Actinomycetota bacterium]
MTAFDNVRRKRTTVMLGACLAVLLGVGGLAYAGVKALRKYEGATKVGHKEIRIPSTPVGMLATVDAQNRLTSIEILVLLPKSNLGGSIVSVPVSADTTLGTGTDRIPFTEVYATGGIDELALSVESALSVTLDVYQVADPATLAALLGPLGTIDATLPNAAGDTFPAGAISLTADQAAQVINHTEVGQTDSVRRGDVEAVWAAVAAAVGSGVATVDASAPGTTTAGATLAIASVGDLLARLFAGPVGARAIPAEPVDAATNPGGKDVEALDRVDAIMVLASIAPRAMSAPAPGLVFRIEAPAGYEAQVRVAVAIVLLGGGNVQSVYLNGPSQANTNVLIRDTRLEDQTGGANTGLFGPTDVSEPKTSIEGIDVIVQLGGTWLDDPASLGQTAASTTVPATATT